MNIIKYSIVYVVTLIWYITMQEKVTKALPGLRNVYLQNTHANRAFVLKYQGSLLYKDINFVICKFAFIGRNRAGKMIFVPIMPSTGQVITARLALGKNSDEITSQARNIKTKITGNLLVVFTAPEIAALGTQINTYEDAKGAAKDVAFNAMNKTLKSYLVRIQAAADASTTGNQIVIIQSTGCIVQGVGGSHEQVFDGFPGIASGTMTLVGTAGPGGHICHEWWSSVDGIVWVRLQSSIHANTLVIGLTPGVLMHFRHQIIDSNGGTGMSDPIARMVK